ncbi:Endochitinase A [Dichanthelium oligosanthes]|uniref:chitinase n=1 Tax=Dichanthelium oligosanthes TaxID=888268 RepID=A0A1E5WIU1_9POAL|nr:Endochitinase A [Dichanthelium oligosanthes]
MANSATTLTVLALGLAALLCAAGPAAAQNCGCQPGYCCSKFGYCGLGDPYCGDGCQSGPCYSAGSGSVDVASVVTDAFFDGIKSQAGGGCEGTNFYSRSAFLNAVGAYSGFAHGGSGDDGKREIAAFFAHATHETGHFCYISEINKDNTYCDPSYTQWPCAADKKYYGRGPLQISWNYNYGPAGQSINFDGLGNPDVVAQDPVIAFKTALWYWMNNVHQVMPQGFGATIRAINGALECNGNNPAQMNARVGYYQQYCQQFGVSPGDNLTC